MSSTGVPSGSRPKSRRSNPIGAAPRGGEGRCRPSRSGLPLPWPCWRPGWRPPRVHVRPRCRCVRRRHEGRRPAAMTIATAARMIPHFIVLVPHSFGSVMELSGLTGREGRPVRNAVTVIRHCNPPVRVEPVRAAGLLRLGIVHAAVPDAPAGIALARHPSALLEGCDDPPATEHEGVRHLHHRSEVQVGIPPRDEIDETRVDRLVFSIGSLREDGTVP